MSGLSNERRKQQDIYMTHVRVVLIESVFLLISLRGLDVRSHFKAIFIFLERRALYKNILVYENSRDLKLKYLSSLNVSLWL